MMNAHKMLASVKAFASSVKCWSGSHVGRHSVSTYASILARSPILCILKITTKTYRSWYKAVVQLTYLKGFLESAVAQSDPEHWSHHWKFYHNPPVPRGFCCGVSHDIIRHKGPSLSPWNAAFLPSTRVTTGWGTAESGDVNCFLNDSRAPVQSSLGYVCTWHRPGFVSSASCREAPSFRAPSLWQVPGEDR